MVERIKEPLKLSTESEKELRDIGPDLALLENELVKAKRAGIDVSELEVKMKEMKTLRTGLLREYT